MASELEKNHVHLSVTYHERLNLCWIVTKFGIGVLCRNAERRASRLHDVTASVEDLHVM